MLERDAPAGRACTYTARAARPTLPTRRSSTFSTFCASHSSTSASPSATESVSASESASRKAGRDFRASRCAHASSSARSAFMLAPTVCARCRPSLRGFTGCIPLILGGGASPPAPACAFCVGFASRSRLRPRCHPGNLAVIERFGSGASSANDAADSFVAASPALGAGLARALVPATTAVLPSSSAIDVALEAEFVVVSAGGGGGRGGANGARAMRSRRRTERLGGACRCVRCGRKGCVSTSPFALLFSVPFPGSPERESSGSASTSAQPTTASRSSVGCARRNVRSAGASMAISRSVPRVCEVELEVSMRGRCVDAGPSPFCREAGSGGA
ncbi:hypothetical protein C8R47DRAFT_1086375 [Mycena vitilis]|nr:hypothetical protein C8R47DRAFT_1086375 [Mycena vitilis]